MFLAFNKIYTCKQRKEVQIRLQYQQGTDGKSRAKMWYPMWRASHDRKILFTFRSYVNDNDKYYAMRVDPFMEL